MRSRKLCVFMCVGLVWLFCGAAEGKDESGVTTVVVNCKTGGSINEALKVSANELVIEIRGMCRENVTVSRDWVTLRGGNSKKDGIESQLEDPFVGGLRPAVVAWKANRVVFENLTLRGGISSIGNLYYGPTDLPFAYLYGEFYHVTNCVLEGGAVNVSVQDGYLALRDVTVRDSRTYGIFSHRGQVECLRCSVEIGAVSFGAGVSLSNFSRGYFTDSTIVAGGATPAFEMYVSSRTWLISSQITAEEYALVAGIGSHLGVSDSVFSGVLSVSENSEIRLVRSTQTANPWENWVGLDSTLDTNNATLVGPLSIGNFGKAVLRGTTTVDGDLICDMGGDAVAHSTVNITGSISGCVHLPTP